MCFYFLPKYSGSAKDMSRVLLEFYQLATFYIAAHSICHVVLLISEQDRFVRGSYRNVKLGHITFAPCIMYIGYSMQTFTIIPNMSMLQ